MTLLIVTALAALAGASGCAQARRGAAVPVEQSGSKPDWVERSPQSDDPMLFVGEITNARDQSLAKEAAEYEAIKRIAGSIGQEVNGEFSRMIKGSDRVEAGSRLGTTIESVVNARIRDVTVRGARHVETWWARYETEGADGTVTNSFRVAVLVKIPRRDYEQAKLEFVNQLSGSDQIKANEDAARALEEFKARLQGGK